MYFSLLQLFVFSFDLLSVAVFDTRDRVVKKKADLCLNLYPCVIKYYLILSHHLLLSRKCHVNESPSWTWWMIGQWMTDANVSGTFYYQASKQQRGGKDSVTVATHFEYPAAPGIHCRSPWASDKSVCAHCHWECASSNLPQTNHENNTCCQNYKEGMPTLISKQKQVHKHWLIAV